MCAAALKDAGWGPVMSVHYGGLGDGGIKDSIGRAGADGGGSLLHCTGRGGTAETGEMPPYVYFDAPGYAAWANYPPSQPPQLQSRWGVCIPYLRSVNDKVMGADSDDASTWDRSWVNERTFQIISSGLSGVYGMEEAAPPDRGRSASGRLPRVYPGDDENTYTRGDQDNLTSFAAGTLGDEREKAKP